MSIRLIVIEKYHPAVNHILQISDALCELIGKTADLILSFHYAEALMSIIINVNCRKRTTSQKINLNQKQSEETETDA